jgi:hypothetical protein
MALFIQAVTLTVLRWRLGRGWLRRPVSVLIVTEVVYSGLAELILAIPSIRAEDTYRLGTGQHYIDRATLVMSTGLLALVLCYLAARPHRAAAWAAPGRAALAARALNWRICLLACVPFAVLTYQGRGYNSAVAAGAAGTTIELASEFFAVLVVLTAFAFLLRHGMRWFFPALAAQSVVLAAAGERSPIVIAVVVLFVLLDCVSMRPSRRQIGVTVALVVVVVLGLTGYRAVSGYEIYRQRSSLATRTSTIQDGLDALMHTSGAGGNPGVIAQAADRFDGNAFAGDVLQAMSFGRPALGAGPVWESMLVVVPSWVWPSKLDHTSLNPAQSEFNEFGIQPGLGVWAGPVPTFPGLYLGFLGPYWLIAFLAGLGLLFGYGERWLFRRFSVPRLVMVAAAVQAALAYEGGWPAMLVILRTGLILAAVVWAAEAARNVVRHPAESLSGQIEGGSP